MKLKLFGWVLFEIICFIIIYFALFKENAIAGLFVQFVIGVSLLFISCLFVILKRNQIPITSLYRPTTPVIICSSVRDSTLGVIFFMFGWIYCAIAILLIGIMNILIIKHIDDSNETM